MIQEDDNGLAEQPSNIVPALRPFMTHLKSRNDVWNEDADEQYKLKSLLKLDGEGSKVIVTTRSSKVATIMGTTFSLHLKGLSHDECWALFKQRAFTNDQEDYPNLLSIGKQIVRKCGGVPLAAKSLGSLIWFKREPDEWLSTLPIFIVSNEIDNFKQLSRLQACSLGAS
ncbi:hypothetical protein V6N13_059294 [Hibiscus sabdariffa]